MTLALQGSIYVLREGCGYNEISRMVFGRATPTALQTWEQHPWGAVRMATVRFLSSCRTTSCKAIRSRLMSIHSKFNPDASSRLSSSFFITRARKLQKTCPMILSSNLWYMGLVSRTLFKSRKTLCKALHKVFYGKQKIMQSYLMKAS